MTTLTPTLVIAPVSGPVTLDEVKAHLRVDSSDEDGQIAILIAAAVGYLDGWRGILGRAIMPQTWRVTVESSGAYVLPMPDVTSATFGGDTLEVSASCVGPVVVVSDAGDIDFTCAMDAAQLAVAKVAILFLVGHWFANREAVSVGSTAVLPMALDMLISSVRWRVL
jgi:hypothetical protein